MAFTHKLPGRRFEEALTCGWTKNGKTIEFVYLFTACCSLASVCRFHLLQCPHMCAPSDGKVGVEAFTMVTESRKFGDGWELNQVTVQCKHALTAGPWSYVLDHQKHFLSFVNVFDWRVWAVLHVKLSCWVYPGLIRICVWICLHFKTDVVVYMMPCLPTLIADVAAHTFHNLWGAAHCWQNIKSVKGANVVSHQLAVFAFKISWTARTEG